MKQPTPFAYGTFVLQLNTDGDFKWIKIIEDITTPNIGIAQAPDRGVYMSSDLSMSLVVGTDSVSGSGWGGDFVLMRLDSNGIFLWARDIPDLSLCGFTLGAGFHMDSDERFNIYLAGASRNVIHWPDSSVIGRPGNTMVTTLLIYDQDGFIYNHIIAEAGGAGSLFSVDASANGDFAITGKMADSQTFNGITKNITDGGYHPYFLYYKNIMVRINSVSSRHGTYRIYPNPLSVSSSLIIEKESTKPERLEIVNASGKIVLSHIIENPVCKIQIDGLPPGMYFVRIDGAYIQKVLIGL